MSKTININCQTFCDSLPFVTVSVLEVWMIILLLLLLLQGVSYLFVAKKQKEEKLDVIKSGNFIFSNGDRYGT